MTAQTTGTTERPPIVAVLGHVDHGKSTLLDYIRKSNIVEGEAGGITQHVAAYEVEHTTEEGKLKRITFIDTPGHAAFKAIRARGASIADIAILVVSADDGVKAQTLEALASIRASETPFVVAINKIDKPNADVERTKVSLLENDIYIEGMGGDVPWAAISAKTGQGIPELLDLVLLAAELEELKADPAANAEGYIVESHRDPKRGIAATMIITNGSMKAGDSVLSGTSMAPVRIFEDHLGETLKKATFSTPVTIIGFDDMPTVGEQFATFGKKKDAESARATNATAAKDASKASSTEADDGTFVLPVIIKADVTGSLEAIEHELEKVGDEYGRLKIVHKGIGTVSEGDVKAAVAAGAHARIVHFNVGVDPAAVEVARQNGISVEGTSIIYELVDNLERVLGETRPKQDKEEVLGTIRVLKDFSRTRDQQTIGGKVTSGVFKKGGLIKIIRGEEEVGSGEVLNIQSGKQNVDTIEEGNEFGAVIEAVEGIEPGDTLECFVMTKV